MRIPRSLRTAVAPVLALALVAACSSGDDSSEPGTTSSGAVASTAPGGDSTVATDVPGGTSLVVSELEQTGEWSAPVDTCADPEAAAAPFGDTIRIGSVMPLSGGPAAGFAPVARGFELYIDAANAAGLVEGHELELIIEDDQYNKDLTPAAVERLLAQRKVDVVSAILGTPGNAAVRDLLNDVCMPHLNALTGSPEWGRAAEYPWTTGGLVSNVTESRVYAAQIQRLHPDGTTVAIFSVNNEFGKIYVDAFDELAADRGITIVERQTIEATDANPPRSQLTAIAAARPEVIMAIPLGNQCPTFLKELANLRAENAGWEPQVFLTNSCASRLFVGKLSGEAGVGVITSNAFVDVADPAFDGEPGVAAFKAAYEAAGLDPEKFDLATTATGWTAAEVTVAILRAARARGPLTRASVMEAARTLRFTPSLARSGVRYSMRGTDDAFAFESLQPLQWDGTNYISLGDTITEFESD